MSPERISTITTTVAFRHRYACAIPDSWRNLLGLSLKIIASSNEHQTAYALQTRIPFFPVFGCLAFVMFLSIRCANRFWPSISVLGGSINFVNVIPVESEVVAACTRGDLLAVQTQFLDKKASPRDMTINDKSLIYVSLFGQYGRASADYNKVCHSKWLSDSNSFLDGCWSYCKAVSSVLILIFT